MRSLTEYNPLTRTRFRIRNASYNRFYGGLRGNVAGITYRGEIGYKSVQNLALYRAEQGIELPASAWNTIQPILWKFRVR